MEMDAFLTSIGAFFTQVIEWVGAILDMIMANPALLVLVIGMSIVGFVFGILGRLLRS